MPKFSNEENSYSFGKMRAGLIGCGQIAGGYNHQCIAGRSLTHACSYQLLENVKLVAVSDPNSHARETFAKRWRVESYFADHQRMLAESNLDIVSICSPTEYHLDAFKAISQSPSVKAVFCEKPLSYDLEEAYEINRLAHNLHVSLNYFRRWNPSLQQLRKALLAGDYGDVLYVTVRYTKGLLTNGSHFVDLLYWFFGLPVTVNTYRIHETPKHDPGVDFRLIFSDGVDAVFLHMPELPYVYIEIDILTSSGKLSIGQRGQTIEWSPAVTDQDYRTFNVLQHGERKETAWPDCPTRALKELIAAINNHGEISCTPLDGVRVAEICDQVLANANRK